MVSGGGRGLGAAIVARLVADGWTVSVGARDVAAAEAALADHGDRVRVARFDALDPASAESWMADTADAFGRLDALINNAGILRMVTFEEGSEEDLDRLWDVNFKAPFRLIKLALPHLKRAGHGRIVNIASTDGKRYRDATASIGYVATKHALVALTHAARFAGWSEGVRATAICPGAIDTEMIANLPGVTAAANRLKPETIADMVGFLLTLPNEASVPEMIANTRLESTL
jgi:NAD(P)-dependent dehydrogenase (short-subunit alcohol dehydrogenase family)